MIRLVLPPALMLAGCAQLPFPGGRGDAPPPPASVVAAPQAGIATPTGRSAAVLDTVSEAEKAEARAAAETGPVGGILGETVVALGDPGDPGLWVKTDLIGRDTPGSVRTGSGDAIAVTLRPLGSDGGAQISLSALQALGLPLTGLHLVTVAVSG
ncbi:MAG: D-galactarate dehydratase [Pseudomonadota bacterium]